MKLASLSCLVALVVLGSPLFSVRALDPSLFNDGFAPLTPALAQFFTDLEAIPAGSVVTDAQHQTLVADLTALPPGPAAPDAAALDSLAIDFGSLAVAGLVDDDLEYLLAMDFEVDPDDADSWLAYVWNDVLFTLHPPTDDPGTDDPTLPYQTLGPGSVNVPPGILIDTGHDVIPPTRLITRFSINFAPVYRDTADQISAAYSGTVRVKTYGFRGVEPSSTLMVSTEGLPLHDTYTLSAVRKSNGTSVVLGKFRAHGSGQPLPVPVYASSRDLAAAGSQPFRARFDSRSFVAFGGNSKRLLPTDFDPTDIDRVKVTNSQGQTVLTRKFSSPNAPTGQVRRTTVSLGGGAPDYAYGIANALYKTAPGQTTRSTFHFSARQLPAHTALTLTIDGVLKGQYVSTNDGRLVIEQGLPSRTETRSGKPVTVNPLQTGDTDLSNMRALSLTDAEGAVLLSGSF